MLRFTWDRKKAETNLSKHGVTFEEAMTVFGDPFELMIADPDHSDDEERSISLGRSESGRILFVVYVEADEVIRLISARDVETAERAAYVAGCGGD